MRSKTRHFGRWASWIVLVVAALDLSGCGLGDVGPDLAKWQAEHGDAVGDSPGSDGTTADAAPADTPADTSVVDAQDVEVAEDAVPDNVGGKCDLPSDCPPPADCMVATCDAHICGVKEQICEQDSNPCDQEQCLVGKCVHNAVNGQGCDDGSACTGPDVCSGGACSGPSLLGSKQLGKALFFGLLKPEPGHTLAWSSTSIVDLDGLWPAWSLGEDASITAAAAVSAQELLVFEALPWPAPHAQVLRVKPATAQQDALPAEVLPPGTKHCNAALRLPDQRVAALCSGKSLDGKSFAMVVLLGLGGEAPRWIAVSDVEQQPWAAELVGGEVWFPLSVPDAALLARVDLLAGKVAQVKYEQSQLSMITSLVARPGGPVLAMGQKFANGKSVGTAALLDLGGNVSAQPDNTGLHDFMVFAAQWQAGVWLTEGVPMQGGLQRRHEVLGPNLESLQVVVHAPDDVVLAIAGDGKGNLWMAGGTETAPVHGTVWRVASTGETTCDKVECVKKPGSCVVAGCQVAWCSTAGCQTQVVADGPCDDGAPCTYGKTCSAGSCAGGSALSCNDSLPCTLDSCEPAQGCVHSPAAATTPCDDGDLCFAADVCNSTGGCVPGSQPLACDSPGLCQSATCTHFLGCGIAQKADGDSCNGDVGICVASQCMAPFAAALAAGPSHSCALKADHSLWCWGSNADGQLLDVGLASTPTATMTGGANYAQVAVGEGFSCGIDLLQHVWCWGRNDHGQTGDSASKTALPKQVSLPIAATQVVAGASHVCARGPDQGAVQRVYCWGAAGQGELGQGSGAVDSATPQEVSAVAGATTLASGPHTTCSVVGGKVYCWGAHATGWVNGKGSPKPGAANLVDLTGMYQVLWVGDGIGCAQMVSTSTGTVECWGMADNPLLGAATGSGFAVTQLTLSFGYRDVAVGSNHLCAIANDTGAVWCRTTNTSAADFGNQSGDGSIATKLFAGEPAATLSSAGKFVCARMVDGSVRCAGTGVAGQAPVFGTQPKAYNP